MKYTNKQLLGNMEIKNDFQKINDNSTNLTQDLTDLFGKDSATQLRITEHANGNAEKHGADDVVFAPYGPITNTNVQGAINQTVDRVDNIIASSGTSSTEVVDARLSSVNGANATLKLRLDAHDNSAMPHIMNNLQNGKRYRYGYRLSATGVPQVISQEVI